MTKNLMSAPGVLLFMGTIILKSGGDCRCTCEGATLALRGRQVEMAELICEVVPSVEKVRMCNSGTEATMSAIRLARGYTGRDKIIKFAGCYHGHVDSLLVKAGSGAITLGNPDSAGVPSSFAEQTIVLPYNNLEAVTETFTNHGDEIAAIIWNLFLPIAD